MLEAAAVYASEEIFELFFYGKPNVAEKDDTDTNHNEKKLADNFNQNLEVVEEVF